MIAPHEDSLCLTELGGREHLHRRTELVVGQPDGASLGRRVEGRLLDETTADARLEVDPGRFDPAQLGPDALDAHHLDGDMTLLPAVPEEVTELVTGREFHPPRRVDAAHGLVKGCRRGEVPLQALALLPPQGPEETLTLVKSGVIGELLAVRKTRDYDLVVCGGSALLVPM